MEHRFRACMPQPPKPMNPKVRKLWLLSLCSSTRESTAVRSLSITTKSNSCSLQRKINIEKERFSFFLFWPHCTACGILVSWPRIEPRCPIAVKAQSPNHWTTREVPKVQSYMTASPFLGSHARTHEHTCTHVRCQLWVQVINCASNQLAKDGRFQQTAAARPHPRKLGSINLLESLIELRATSSLLDHWSVVKRHNSGIAR